METFQQQLLLHSGKARTTDATAFSISDIWSSLYSVPRPSGAVSYKQSAWDKVAVASEREILTNSVSDNVNKARLLVVMAPHSGDWLHALPLSNCGLRLNDSAVHIAVGLRLGATSVSRISVHVEHRSMPEVNTVSRVKGTPVDQHHITG